MFGHRVMPIRPATLAGAAILVAGLAALAPPLAAQDTHHRVTPVEEVTFGPAPPFLPEGAQIAVLYGDPGAAGEFVVRLRFPAGYAIPAHSHTMDEIMTVISGQLGLAAGDKLDRKAAPLLAPGSFAMLPAGMTHFAWAKEETVVQLNGMGPFDTTYLADSDDPRIN